MSEQDKPTQRCTECGKVAAALWTRTWSRDAGDIIKEGEALCRVCRAARGGKSLKQIEREMCRGGER